ncbi:unnamed protein product [Cylindrotheca closterium]|uniref:Uncharacterized protein n=1 Tax=Cylindrotheca closterium TaxID=2856 RepID=A0AAD2CQY4_9STRA|nr:unnamed protein product [Cylindrotheca closterium]
MSAYALPGLFPPIQPSLPKETGNASSSSLNDLGLFGPLHEQDNVASTKSTGVFSSSPYLFSQESSESDDSKGDEPGIHVTEAKVDPVRLVQSVSRPKGHSNKKNQLRRRNSKDRLEESAKDPSNSEACSKDEGGRSMHDEAIEFALAISFNGRKYTAKRTMQRIIQLRDDLITEMDDRRRWLLLRKSKLSRGSAEDCEYIEVEIPEIPFLTGEQDGSGVGAGFVGRGFSMLHAMATSYGPVMERWLRNVLAVVPQDSETLMNFLWEPLAHESPVMDSPTKACVTWATLGSIKELECATDDDSESEDEDEWEG